MHGIQTTNQGIRTKKTKYIGELTINLDQNNIIKTKIYFETRKNAEIYRDLLINNVKYFTYDVVEVCQDD
jgi:hypothetical protein